MKMRSKYYIAMLPGVKLVNADLKELRHEVNNMVKSGQCAWESVKMYSVLNGKLRRLPR